MALRSRFMRHLSKIFDLGALVVFLYRRNHRRQSLPAAATFSGFMSLRIKLGNFLLFGMLLTLWNYVFLLCGLYVSNRLTTWRAQLFVVGKATLLAAAVLLLAAELFRVRMVSLSFVLVFWLFCTAMMVAWRLVARGLLPILRRRGRNRRFVLVLGTNERAIEFARQIAGQPDLGYHIVGFVDDDWKGTSAFEASGHRRRCTFDGLAEFLRHNVVDEAVIYLPLRSYYEHAAEIVSRCEQHGIVIRFDAQIFKLKTSPSRADNLDDTVQVLTVAGAGDSLPFLFKRALDCIFSALLLILSAPSFCGGYDPGETYLAGAGVSFSRRGWG